MPNQNHIRSEAINDILTKAPHWMLVWGNLVILIFIVVFFIFSWFLKYPDIITSQAIITSQQPVQKVYAQKQNTIFELRVQNNQEVTINTILVVFKNTAKLEDVMLLKSVVDTIDTSKSDFIFPTQKLTGLSFGEISNTYTKFVSHYNIYALNKSLKPQKNKIENIELFEKTIHSLVDLKEAIRKWESDYILRSSITGTISFIEIWNETQHINKGDLLFTIIPKENKTYFAKIKAPVVNSGKIKKGQNVNLKLLNYPEDEYGVLPARIASMSAIPNDEGFYLAHAYLSSKLITSYDVEIPFKGDIQAKAEIITEDLRLLERFFYQLKGLFN